MLTLALSKASTVSRLQRTIGCNSSRPHKPRLLYLCYTEFVLRNIKNVITFSIIPCTDTAQVSELLRHGKQGSTSPLVNTIVADVLMLAAQSTKISATTVLTWFPRNIQISTLEGLKSNRVPPVGVAVSSRAWSEVLVPHNYL